MSSILPQSPSLRIKPKTQRGYCPFCFTSQKLRVDGTLCRHDRTVIFSGDLKQCVGTGQKPGRNL